MITEEEERRISAGATISASAAACRRRRCLSTKHLHRGALTPPNFKVKAIDMAYDLHGIDPGRFYATYFAGDGGLVVEADKFAWGCWLKHLPEDVIIGCPTRDNFWEVRGICSCLILPVVVGLPRGFVFALGAEGPLSVHLLSLPTFLSSVLDFLPDMAFFLYDTLGFPINLTELMAQEAGMTVDMEGFVVKMEGQKRRLHKARLAARGLLRWQGQGQWWWWQRWGGRWRGWWQGWWQGWWRERCQGQWGWQAQRRQWQLQLWWVAVAVEVAAVVVVVMGIGGSSGIGEGEGSGGNKANSGDSDGRGPYNNQLKDPAEETTGVATVMATDTATATVKATKKDENNACNDDSKSRIATKTASPGYTLRQRPLHCLGIQCRWQ
jgi:hypothetical protein